MRRAMAIFRRWDIRPLLPEWRREPDALIIDIKAFCSRTPALTGTLWWRHGGCTEFITALDPSVRLPANAAAALAVIRLPPAMTLRREVVLPAKAESHLRRTLAFEMDRLTPFDPGDVLWSISGLKRGKENLQLTLSLVPMVIAKPLLLLLQQMNLSPSCIETDGGRIPLGKHRRWQAAPIRSALTGICCLLALAIAMVPLAQQQYQLDQVEHRLTALSPARQELTSLRRQLAISDAVAAISAAAHDNGDALDVLTMLTNALPDGTWLNSLTITPAQIIFSGESGDAAHLMSVLAAAPGVVNPTFIGPITRTSEGATLFSIAASVSK